MISQDQATWYQNSFSRVVANVEQAISGKIDVIRLACTCLFAEGHLLLDDVPGTGKTSLARALAQTMDADMKRIQFTPDLLPSDVTGVKIYDQTTGTWPLHKGPIFASIVLADEINRASAKTQSALLEVMEESQATIDGDTFPVVAAGHPFMVIATQNPVESAGTYRLPEAQLDRFLIRTKIGPADHDTTVAVLERSGMKSAVVVVPPILKVTTVSQMIEIASNVTVHRDILSYITRLAEATRTSSDVKLGVSMRGCIMLTRAVKAWAAANGRTYVIPDDVKDLAAAVFAHRIGMTADAEFSGRTGVDVMVTVLSQIAPPSGL